MAGEAAAGGGGGGGAAVGLYAQAMVGVIDLMTGAGRDAAYEAAFGKFYNSYQGMHNAARQRVAAEANIAAVQQDRINTDTVIAMKQDQAQAAAKVAAAVSGVEGQSVDATIYQTEVNSSVAKANNTAYAEQQIENQLANIYQSQSTLLALDNTQTGGTSAGMGMAQGVASIISNPAITSQLMDSYQGLFGVDTVDSNVAPDTSGIGIL